MCKESHRIFSTLERNVQRERVGEMDRVYIVDVEEDNDSGNC